MVLSSWSECRPVGGHFTNAACCDGSHALLFPDVVAKARPAACHRRSARTSHPILLLVPGLSLCGSSGSNRNQRWPPSAAHEPRIRGCSDPVGRDGARRRFDFSLIKPTHEAYAKIYFLTGPVGQVPVAGS